MLLKKLQKGDTIGIINPASSNYGELKTKEEVKEKYQYMFDYFEKEGYKIKLGKTFYSKWGYLGGTDEERAQDINDMFRDDKVKMILCMRGGYGLSRIVDKLDYEMIKKHPKIVCGYSDITVLLNNVYKFCGFPTIHGLIAAYFGKDPLMSDKLSYNDFFNATAQPQLNRVLSPLPNEKKQCETLIDGVAEGVLVGGNLSLLATLCGTKYEVDFTDKIVLIEDVGEAPYAIDRYLSSLRLRGMLEKAKGFVFGYFTDCNPQKDGVTCMDVVRDYIMPLNKPTIVNFTTGHEFPFVNMPIGAKVKLDSVKKEITIMEEIYE